MAINAVVVCYSSINGVISMTQKMLWLGPSLYSSGEFEDHPGNLRITHTETTILWWYHGYTIMVYNGVYYIYMSSKHDSWVCLGMGYTLRIPKKLFVVVCHDDKALDLGFSPIFWQTHVGVLWTNAMKNRNKSQNMEQLGVSMSRSSRCATMEATEFEWEATDRLREASKTWDLCKKMGTLQTIGMRTANTMVSILTPTTWDSSGSMGEVWWVLSNKMRSLSHKHGILLAMDAGYLSILPGRRLN